MWMTPLTRCFSRMEALRFGDLGPLVRAAVGRCPIAAGNCRALCEGLPTRLVSPWTGLAHRPSWYRRRQAGAAVVLTGRAICVPF
jgi:hypothetical protein